MRHFVTVTHRSGRVRRWSHLHVVDENGVTHWSGFRWEA